jgi:hypothetical protein
MPHDSNSVEEFVARWKESGAAERANFQPFLGELCDVLGIERPAPAQADDERNAYVFERTVVFNNGDGTTNKGRIDLYKRGCFVMEAKQGSDRVQASAPLFGDVHEQASKGRGRKGTAVRGTRGWDVAMRRARGQAEQYVRALPPSEGNPPFLVVVDVGYSFELYSDFSRAGKTYIPFPDARTHRVLIEDLSREEVRETLRQIWTDPLSLDPSRRSARVTRGVAEQLAALARSLEASGYKPERAANFLMRAIFTMFAEDVGLIPHESFTEALALIKRNGVEIFADEVSSLWATMNKGGYTSVLKKHVIQFNGGLFEDCEALPLDASQLDLLIEASRADWKDVEPAIFGTLLENALNTQERKMRGAHYTPRAYVERLVMPTIIEPLRQEWADVLVAAAKLANEGKLEEAAEQAKAFHRRLCRVRVLDPACGSGNFLYVTLEHLKRLEGEVLDALHGFGESQGVLEDTGLTVDPHQLLGIEVNPRAAAITDLVLWIGYLQWHFRTRGEVLPPQPVIKKFHNIECRDAVLAYDGVEEVLDDDGRPVTRWDGRTYKKHPVTGEDVPDETARVPLLRYLNPRKAVWPEADFIVGNPPFIGNSRMRSVLGDGYVETLRKTYDDVPESSDYVMYWWEKAAELMEADKIQRFGFITTNSLRQTFNRKVLEKHFAAKNPISLVFAIPDHPWVDSAEGAAVRISMTVAEHTDCVGVLAKVEKETDSDSEDISVELVELTGKIFSDLTIGANVAGAMPLKANERLSYRGVSLVGAGFLLTPDEANQLGLGRISGLETYIKMFRSGRDLTSTPRQLMVIDLLGLTEGEVRSQFPEVYQWLFERVKPERDQNNRESYRELWWIFGEPRKELRVGLEKLPRYIATPRTAKHRFFTFLLSETLPESEVIAITLEHAFFLGVLSSRIHVAWALAAGGRLGIGNDPRYTNSRCFDTFPFPNCTQKERIRELGESLDAHRKRQQAQNPSLTITEMYNVLEKLRRDEPLNDRERVTHEQGLVSVLRQIHDELDAAVFDAYGWPASLSDEEILERLVRLNAERAAEERSGLVRWLRPEFQKPSEGVAAAFGEEFAAHAPAAAKQSKQPWPKTIPEQARAVRLALATQRGVVTPQQLARAFQRANVGRIEELLQTLVSLGQAREVGEGRYTS